MTANATHREAGIDAAAEAMPVATRRRLMVLAAAVLLTAAASILSIVIGARSLSVAIIWEAFTNYNPDLRDHVIIVDSRLPRTLAGLAVGPALGISGALIQSFTRNPLADPGILGINAGAGLLVMIGVVYFGVVQIWGYVWFSMIGALGATALVYAIGSIGRDRATPAKLTLAGIAIGAVIGGIASVVTVHNRLEVIQIARSWGIGSLAGIRTDVLVFGSALIAVGCVLAFACARSLNMLALGDDLGVTMGVQVNRVRFAVVVAVMILVGAAVATAGPIGFIGLMVPHVVRWLVGPDQRWILPITFFGSAALILFADVVGRVAIPGGTEVEVAIVTAFIGAPILILLARRSNAIGL